MMERVPGGIARLFRADFMRVGHDYAASPLASWAGMEPWVPKTPMPSPFEYAPTIGPDPCWIDRDFLLVVRHGELGVERVEGYRIRRGE